MSLHKVSACIVTHNNINYIEKTVETLLQFTKGVDFKLYIVDNLSTDGTPELVEEKFKDRPELQIIRTGENRGFGAGHNVVLPLIDSEYHAVINPDIIIDDDIITKMVDFMEANTDINLLSPRICFPDGRNQILGKRNPSIAYLASSRLRDESNPSEKLREYAMLDADYTKPFDIQNATGCFMFFRTKVFKEIGGFDKRYFMYFEDCDITRTICQNSRAVYYPDAIVYHVWGRDSKRNFKLLAIQIMSMFKYFYKWRKD